MGQTLILGGGITGLNAGISVGGEILEARETAGGICASYYIDYKGRRSFFRNNDESYRFETGGGHWIFKAEKEILEFINSMVKLKKYERNSAVYFPGENLYVPFPLQNNLSYLPKRISGMAIDEIMHPKGDIGNTLADWLEFNFGNTLCKLFFFPFHELYTAGLYKHVSPRDRYKTPADKKLIIKGAKENTFSVGYNKNFMYPYDGLDALTRGMAARCNIKYKKEVKRIDLKSKEVICSDGSRKHYEKIISTLPLDRMLRISGITLNEPAGPYTSVAVINIGAKKGRSCPRHHWLYVPKSKSGFYRVGFYSNVDKSFLPKNSTRGDERVSVYVEKAFTGTEKPDKKELGSLCQKVGKELQEWKFISDIEIIDPTWVEVAYTWEYPNSRWKQKAIESLRGYRIYQIGRYGKWEFQGIADSIKDGLRVKENK